MMQTISKNRDEPKCLPKTTRTNLFYKESTILLATQTNGYFLFLMLSFNLKTLNFVTGYFCLFLILQRLPVGNTSLCKEGKKQENLTKNRFKTTFPCILFFLN